MSEELVLAPGLWMPGVAMRVLAGRLSQRGYRVHIFDYHGRAPFDANVEALARFAKGKAFFVGHSLGGVLVLEMLNRHPEIKAQAAVLLGAPVGGCLAGRRLGAARLGRWMMGACRELWDERPARWRAPRRLAWAAPSADCPGRTMAWYASTRRKSTGWRAARWSPKATAC
jgi:pimeloyl-ACP methyl ester carboxylesterase